jgi:glycosyltransferase involved in cell wall biosynthesis
MQEEVFIISELFYPNKTSTAYIMTEVAKRLSSEKKMKINVICADVIYDNNYDKGSLHNDFLDLNIIKATKLTGNKNSVFGKIKNAFSTCFAFGRIIVKNVKSTDTIFAVTNPFLLVIVIGIIRVFKKFRYILLVHDVFPENTIPAGLTTEKSLFYKITKLIYDWAYQKADNLIVLGRDMADVIGRKVNNNGEINIIENWFDSDLELRRDVDRNSYLGIDVTDKIIIGFAGNIGRVQNLQFFLNVFKSVENPKLHFVIIGDGAMKTDILEIIEKNCLKNVSYLGPKSRAEQSLFLNCFDYGLITLSKGMYGLGVPSKTYNLLSLGKPIIYIGDKGSEIDLLINQFDIGWSFTWDDPQKILAYLNSLDKIDINKAERSKQIAEENYTQDIILSKINNLVFS